MPWIDYAKATPLQQEDFRHVNPKLGPQWVNYQIWITKFQDASGRRGHWQWTKKYGEQVNEEMRREMRGENVRTRGDLREFKTADFHLNKEPI